MVAPGAGVEVEQLVLPVARIELVLQLDQAVVVDGAQQPLRQRFQLRDLGRLHVRAGAPELERMLAQPSGDHPSHRLSRLEEGAVGELMGTITGDVVLDHHLTPVDDLRRSLEEVKQFCPGVRLPGLGLGGVEEVLFDRRLDRERERGIDSVQVAGVFRVPGPRDRYPETPRQPVGISLVPGPTNGLPAGRGDSKLSGQPLPASGKRRNGLFPGRIEHPAIELEALAHVEQRVDAVLFGPQARHPNRIGGVARIATDRPLIIDDADRDPAAAETAGDTEALVVAAHHDGADLVAHQRSPRAAQAAIRRAATSAPDTNRQIGP